MFLLAGVVAAVFALVFAKGRRVSVAAACWTAGLALSIPRPDHTTPSDWLVASFIVTVVFAAIAYTLVRIVARLTGAISTRLGAPSAP